MDINKIKARLAALRPEDLDPEDPEIGELLMLVEEDLELAEWFAQEQVFDQAFADKLQEIQAPDGLDERIIEAMVKAKAGEAEPPAAPVEPGKPATGPEPEIETGPPAHERELEMAKAEREPEIDPHATEKVTPFEAPPEQPKPTAEPAATGAEEDMGTAVPFKPAPKRAWWQHPSIMSAAATVVLVLTVIGVMTQGPDLSAHELDEFYSTIGEHHRARAPLSLESDSLDTIRSYLGDQGAPVPGELPPSIDPYPEIGCSIMHWGGEAISVIRMDDNETVHVYVVRQGAFPDLSDGPQPRLAELNQVVVLGWTDNNHHYFLVRTGDLTEIENLL